MTRQITADEARSIIAEVIKQSPILEPTRLIKAGEVMEYGHTRVEFSSGIWADEAEVSINETSERGTQGKQVSYEVQVSWSSTLRSPVGAAQALQNYQKAVDLAIRFQAAIERLPAVYRELPE